MSVAAMKLVEQHSPTRGSQRAVLLAFAWAASDGGRGARPSWAKLADRTGLSRRTIARKISELRAEGRLRRHEDCACKECQRAARSGIVVYDVVLNVEEHVSVGQQTLELPVTETPKMAPVGTGAEGCQGCQPDTGRGVTVTPLNDKDDVSLSLDQVRETERPTEHLLLDEAEPQPAAGARARGAACKPVSYRGRTVARQVVETAERLLAVFNAATGGQLAARGRQGQATSALKQIAGALLEHPDEPLGAWERGVRSMIEDPPSWIDGRFMVGHLFGPRAVEHTLARGRSDQPPVPLGRSRGLSATDWGAIADQLEAQEVAA